MPFVSALSVFLLITLSKHFEWIMPLFGFILVSYYQAFCPSFSSCLSINCASKWFFIFSKTKDEKPEVILQNNISEVMYPPQGLGKTLLLDVMKQVQFKWLSYWYFIKTINLYFLPHLVVEKWYFALLCWFAIHLMR